MRDSIKTGSFARRLGISAVGALLAVGMVPGLALADGVTSGATYDLLLQAAANGQDTSGVYDYLEEQTSGDFSIMGVDEEEGNELPSSVDLRERGVVTPVKFQNPWGTCWAFGITAAAETSILSELGTTYEESGLDLSEHHLAWFVKNHLATEDEDGYIEGNSQAGEGLWYKTESDDEESGDEESGDEESGTSYLNESMEGGFDFYGAYAYASGIGVVDEADVPYCGVNKWVQVNDEFGRYDSMLTYDAAIEAGYEPNQIRCYSKADDWSLDESTRFQQKYALQESNILPSVTPTYDQDEETYVLNEDGVNAYKEQLDAGYAINVCYCADSSDPNKEVPESSCNRYMNNANGEWAQFTWSADGSTVASNHSVTIVGYDDDYPAENFTQAVNPAKWDANENVVYQLPDGTELENDKNGNPLDPETGEILDVEEDNLTIAREAENLTTPAGDGAWIVKNSWGDSKGEFPNSNGGNEWGYEGSGYFYMSYYDMSLCDGETFDFAVTDEEKEEYAYDTCYQYDFMPTYSTMTALSLVNTSMANVFTTSEDCKLSGVSCQTAYPGTEVTFQVYLLDDETQDPTDGTLAASLETSFTYGGFHRAQLDEPVYMHEGQRYAVVVTEYVPDSNDPDDGGYVLSFNRNANELYATIYDASYWTKGVVNKGESYLGVLEEDGMTWTDWYDFTYTLSNVNIDDSVFYDYDNFTIKAYTSEVDESEHVWGEPVLATVPTPTEKGTCTVTCERCGKQETKYITNTGWFAYEGTWYYLDEDSLAETGWLQLGKTWYYLDADGVMATGWEKIGKTYYYFKSSGAMVTGWLKSGSTYYYLKSSGAMATGWQKVSGSYYYFASNGKMYASKWLKSGGKWYYLKASGKMAASETLSIGGKSYTFAASGAMK